MWGIIELWEHDRQSSQRLRCNEKHYKVFWARYGARPAKPLVVSNATGFSNHWNLVATCYIQQPNLTLKSPLPKYRKHFHHPLAIVRSILAVVRPVIILRHKRGSSLQHSAIWRCVLYYPYMAVICFGNWSLKTMELWYKIRSDLPKFKNHGWLILLNCRIIIHRFLTLFESINPMQTTLQLLNVSHKCILWFGGQSTIDWNAYKPLFKKSRTANGGSILNCSDSE